MPKPLRSFAAALIALGAAPAMADCVATSHTVQEGETVFTIAEGYYGRLEQWSLIYYSNPGKLSNPLEIPAGTVLAVPCLTDGSGPVANVATRQAEQVELRLVTGSNYAPFTDRSWPGQGLITELVSAALEETPDPVSYSIDWENNWTEHLPSLDAKTYDMGFPWPKPDCEQMPEHKGCSFHYSEPIVELLQLLFVSESSDMTFEQESDIHAKTICRPAGHVTFDLDGAERLWLTNELVKLEQPATPQDCFNLLSNGEVDAVALNEFTGWTTLTEMGLRNEIAPLPHPLGVQGLHAVISKQHWRGTTHLYRINAGLAKLKESDRYDEIVSRHLGVFWNRVN
ncbi:MAG: transporter substrate-binding domain-containing protein [Pseudomonadota bacterium]